jgi:hypothetical protein
MRREEIQADKKEPEGRCWGSTVKYPYKQLLASDSNFRTLAVAKGGFLMSGFSHAGCVLGFLFLTICPAGAQQVVGNAEQVQQDVRGALGANIRLVNAGDQLFQNEVISTSDRSLAKLEMVDLTKLQLGPSSQVKLDRFVYDPGGARSQVVLNVTKGAFRFVTGKADHKTYEIVTPTATIGVRGTVFDVLAVEGKTIAVLKQGAIDVCIRSSSRSKRCVAIDQPGTGTIVTRTQIAAPGYVGWSFDQVLAGLTPAKGPTGSGPAPIAAGPGPARTSQVQSPAPSPVPPAPSPGPSCASKAGKPGHDKDVGAGHEDHGKGRRSHEEGGRGHEDHGKGGRGDRDQGKGH